MSVAEALAAHDDIEARLAQHRHDLWVLGLRAAVLRAEAQRLCRRSRWEARRARRQLQQHLVRGTVTKPSPQRPVRRRSRGRLVVVR